VSSAPSAFILRGALSQTETAATLGISNRTLSDWQKEHPIWRPAVSKPRFCLYPLRQIELLQAVMLGAITDDAAWAQWSSVLSGIVMNARKGA
jgi:hypothetical protein